MTAKSFFAGGMGSAIAGARAVATTHATQQRAPIGANDSALWYARAALADDNLDDQTRLLACEYVIANSPDTTEHARANDLRVLIAGEQDTPADATGQTGATT